MSKFIDAEGGRKRNNAGLRQLRCKLLKPDSLEGFCHHGAAPSPFVNSIKFGFPDSRFIVKLSGLVLPGGEPYGVVFVHTDGPGRFA